MSPNGRIVCLITFRSYYKSPSEIFVAFVRLLLYVNEAIDRHFFRHYIPDYVSVSADASVFSYGNVSCLRQFSFLRVLCPPRYGGDKFGL